MEQDNHPQPGFWRRAFAAIQGRRHREQNAIGAQDVVWSWPPKNGNITRICMAVSDGASSAQRAYVGARTSAQNTAQWLQAFADNGNASGTDCEATLLFVVSDGHHYIVGNLGDGLAGIIPHGQQPRLLLGAERGPTANHTWFTVSPDAAAHLRLVRGELPQDADTTFFLMTDGAADCLYDLRRQTFAPALTTMASWLSDRRNKERIVSAEIL